MKIYQKYLICFVALFAIVVVYIWWAYSTAQYEHQGYETLVNNPISVVETNTLPPKDYDSLDGVEPPEITNGLKTFQSQKYGFSFMYPAEFHITGETVVEARPPQCDQCIVDSPQMRRLNYGLTYTEALASILLFTTDSNTLPITRKAACEEAALNFPGQACERVPHSVSYEDFKQMSQEIRSKRYTETAAYPDGTKPVRPQFLTVDGKVVLWQDSYDFNAQMWFAQAVFFDLEYNKIEIRLWKPGARTVQALRLLPEYTTFQKAIMSLEFR